MRCALLDDYQDCGTRPIDVKAMDLDFYVSGTLKYLLGPPGLAFMYVRKSLAERLTPTITGWFGQANPFAFNEQLLEPAPNARRSSSARGVDDRRSSPRTMWVIAMSRSSTTTDRW